MSEMPERIRAWKTLSWCWQPSTSSGYNATTLHDSDEYIRADLVAAKDAEIERLKAENAELRKELASTKEYIEEVWSR